MKHKCEHDTLAKDLKKEVFGNARKGLKDRVGILEIKLRFLLIGVSVIIGQLTTLLYMAFKYINLIKN